ncbi:hypothetical protein CMV_027228 [Castanea mollissima]|uniref:Uncharacterized protein n=1 Tax=Castanea mollissima TaxID=60419 RepID=A0A8J4V2Y6_9ROSI|nr:hypothetical protein CMV_027228 [Castanea mollissima]
MLFVSDGLPRWSHCKPRTLQDHLGPPRKLASPEPSQALSRGYEWVGFVKSDMGCGWVSAALSGFMMCGYELIGVALAYGCGSD